MPSQEARYNLLHEVYVLLTIASKLLPVETETRDAHDAIDDALVALDPLMDAADHQLSQAALATALPFH